MRLTAGNNPARWLRLSALVFALDQASKLAVEYWMQLGQVIEVLPFFNLRLAYNEGAAFSFLADAGGWQRWFFLIFAIVVVVLLMRWLRKLQPDEGWTALGLSLVIAGALGNLVDRAQYGYVIDFLDFHVVGWHWPAFNLADSAIFMGVIALLWASLVLKEGTARG